jgi:ribosomal protein S18 acetylase RimI-like enzyme
LTNFSIRKGQSSDWQQITFFQKQMALETEGKNLDQELVSQGVLSVFKKTKGFHKGFYLVAESESSLIGSLLVTREWSDWRNGWFWWIQSVYVVADWRRKGVYTELHKTLCEIANQEKNICGIRLYVEKTNQKAQNVYQSQGMSESNYLLYEVEI